MAEDDHDHDDGPVPEDEWDYLCKQMKLTLKRWAVERGGDRLPPALPLYALIVTLTDFCVRFGISCEACVELVKDSPEWKRSAKKVLLQ